MTEVIENEEMDLQAMADAEAMFQTLLGEDPDMMRNSIELCDDDDVGDIQDRLHKAQLNDVKGQLDEVKEEANREIEKLKEQLAKASELDNKAKEEKAKEVEKLKEKLAEASSLDEVNEKKTKEIEKLKEQLAKTMEQQRKDNEARLAAATKPKPKQLIQHPIIEMFTINAKGLQAKFLSCRFTPDKGKIGLEFKRFADAFFVTAIIPDCQASTYVGINRGLLMYQVEIWRPGDTKFTKNIQARDKKELVSQVSQAFYNKNEIVIKFCIPPKGINPHDLEENIIPGLVGKGCYGPPGQKVNRKNTQPQQGRGRGYPQQQQVQQGRGYPQQQQFQQGPQRGLMQQGYPQQQFQQGQGYPQQQFQQGATGYPQQQFQQGQGYPQQQQFQQGANGYPQQQQFQQRQGYPQKKNQQGYRR